MSLQDYKELMKLCCLMMVMAMLMLIAMHLPGWLQGIDHALEDLQTGISSFPAAMESLKSASEYSTLTSQQSLNLVGSATKLVDHTTKKVDSFDVARLNRGVDEIVDDVDDISKKTTGTLGVIDRSVSDTTEVIRDAFDPMAGLLQSGQKTFDAATDLMNGPLTKSINDLDTAFVPAGLLMKDMQTKTHDFLYPGRLTKKQKIWQGVRTFAPFAAPTYWTIRIAKENF